MAGASGLMLRALASVMMATGVFPFGMPKSMPLSVGFGQRSLDCIRGKLFNKHEVMNIFALS
jgi:hypothetical protein